MFASNFRLNLKAAGKGVSAKLTRNYCNRLGNSIPGLCFLWKNPHFRLEWKIPEDAIWVSGRLGASKQNVFSTNNMRALISATFLTELSLYKKENNPPNPTLLIYLRLILISHSCQCELPFRAVCLVFPARSPNISFWGKQPSNLWFFHSPLFSLSDC